MQRLTLVPTEAPGLHTPSAEVSVEEIATPEFQAYLDALIQTMIESDGVGIASPQIGRNIRAVVVQMPQGPECFMNPVITKRSDAMVESEEGCLSVPGDYGIVMRHKRVSVDAVNRHGRRVSLDLKNFPAIVFQHEIDHVNGILYIDKAIRMTRTTKKS
jgi:peptide deformylase